MKLTTQFPFFLREARTAIIADSGKGWYSGAPFKPDSTIKTYYDYYNKQDSVVYASVNSLADAAVGRGFDLECDDEDAKELIEKFCEFHNLDFFFNNIARNSLIAGFLPVETLLVSNPEKCTLTLVHPTTVKEPVWDEAAAQIKAIKQGVGNTEVTIQFKDLAWFCWNKVGNNPFGTSQVAPVARYLAYKDRAVTSMDKILERYASPKGIWKSTSDITQLKQAVIESDAGEDLFLGNLPDEQIDKIVQFLEIDPRVRFWEYIQYIDQLIYVGLGSPNLFYFKDATEASSRTLLEIVDRSIYTLGRMIKREAELKWFKPLCELNGYKEYPKIEWRQKPASQDLSIGEVVNKGLDKGFINQDQYFELLKSMNVTFDAAPTPPPAPQLPFQQPNQPQQNQQEQPTPDQTQESYIVTPIKPHTLMENKHVSCPQSS